jgi:magnesium-transporting ATPase (P-type)
MYNNEETSVFGFGIDETTKSHLISIAKWSKFLAITGIVMSILVILSFVFGSTIFLERIAGLGQAKYDTDTAIAYNAKVFVGVFIFYGILVVMYMIPCFFKLSFSNKMIKALNMQDQQLLNNSFASLKTYNKYWGILSIVLLAIFFLFFGLALIGASIR